jgi:endonuclease/exonuclease/phosphatase family metal-dependent hydrolase
VRVLIWNLFHGRAVPGAGRDLLPDFAAALAGWAWDVALLQEVPPWWPPALGAACGASARSALTSRNELLPLRMAAARRAPDLVKSAGGGSNAILVRSARVLEHRRSRLRRLPERRVVHGVRLEAGVWCVNHHAQVRPERAARRDVAAAARTALAWAGDAPVVLAGDCNLPAPAAPGLEHLGGHGVDHVLGRGVRRVGPVGIPERRQLSDHAPVAVELEPDPAPA